MPDPLSPPKPIIGNWWEWVLFIVYRASIGFGAAYLVGMLPTPWDSLVFALVAVAVIVLMVQVRDRPCSVCGNRPAMPIPKDLSKKRRPVTWWDLRVTNPRTVTWRCFEHVFPLPDGGS